MVLLDAVVRLLPGVIGAAESLTHESFEQGLLEYPHYTKPRDWQGRPTPDVLLSGDHKKIAAWRQAQSEHITAARRPDLLRPQSGQKAITSSPTRVFRGQNWINDSDSLACGRADPQHSADNWLSTSPVRVLIRTT